MLKHLRNMSLRRKYANYGDGKMMYSNIHTRKRKDSVLNMPIDAPLKG